MGLVGWEESVSFAGLEAGVGVMAAGTMSVAHELGRGRLLGSSGLTALSGWVSGGSAMRVAGRKSSGGSKTLVSCRECRGEFGKCLREDGGVGHFEHAQGVFENGYGGLAGDRLAEEADLL